jgi:apolipoprotein N-acyltransferase
MAAPPPDSSSESSRLVYAGLLGLTAATVTQLMGNDSLSMAQTVAVYAFAIASPLLTVALLATYSRRPHSWRLEWAGIGGCFGAIVGMAGLFWHFGWSVGVVFVLLILVAFVLARMG